MEASPRPEVLARDEARDGRVGAEIGLRYVARAGLLPELSRQTYDSLYKALREAVLNALDAEATKVEIDFTHVGETGELIVSDNGTGMTTREFCEQFMSLGGSSKFGEGSRFGRIGIGSLALLQYADAAIVETKVAGSDTITRARIQHPWNLARDERRAQLSELSAGTAQEYAYSGRRRDHFTRLRLVGVHHEVALAGQDPTAFYALLESLRRVLPLRSSDSRLTAELERIAPELVAELEAHIGEWARAEIIVHAPWERDIELRRRSFGDDAAEAEEWSGPPLAIAKTLRVSTPEGSRKLRVLGFLLNQKRAIAAWSGLTARVQNVAVEEQTFFDVTTDPGFRKYITGEIWLMGDVDRERLINIDRSSFNRECLDYQVAQRYLSRVILDFKSAHVQRPQREKVAVRKLLEQHAQTVRAVERVAHVGAALVDAKAPRLPASESGRGRLGRRVTIQQLVERLGAEVVTADEVKRGYELGVSADGTRVHAEIEQALTEPAVVIGRGRYKLGFAEGDAEAAPVVIRERPREIVFNLSHPAHGGENAATKFQLSLALELAYLLTPDGDAAGVYERMVEFMAEL